MCCQLSWRWHFAYACVGCLIGVSVLFGFFQLNNPSAAYWGLASGVFAALAAVYRWRRRPKTPEADANADAEPVLHDAGMRGALIGVAGGGLDAESPAPAAADTSAAPLLPAAVPYAVSTADRAWALVAVCGMIASGGGVCAYTALSIIQSEPLTGASDWMSVVWTFMTLKWAFGLFWAVHTHTRDAHERALTARAAAGQPVAVSPSTAPAVAGAPFVAPPPIAAATVNSSDRV